MVALGSLFFLRWWTPYAIRSRCGAPSRHGLQRQSGLALHDHQQAGDMSPACGTPSDRAAVFALQSAPSLPLPAGRPKPQLLRLGERGRREKSLVSAKGTSSGRIAWTGEGVSRSSHPAAPPDVLSLQCSQRLQRQLDKYRGHSPSVGKPEDGD